MVNLQPDLGGSDDQAKRWEEIGTWHVTDEDQGSAIDMFADGNDTATQDTNGDPKHGGRIDIKDIVWPGGALKPPEGIPEKR